jgi:hypothetical protein
MARRRWFTYESRQRFNSEGVNDAFTVVHESIGRECTDDSPYLIPNEWIASHIGTFLRLPIPPFGLVRKETHKGMFVSMRFGRKESQPKDMMPGPCVRNDPDLCTGILLFDILVANGDRHRGNLKVDDPNNPQQIWVFDHDRGIFGVEAGQGAVRLGRLLTKLGVSDGNAAGDSPNCLLKVVADARLFGPWIDRIFSIPDWFINEICDEVNDWVTADELEAAKSFLRYRKRALTEIINNNRLQFSSIKDWGLFI